MRWRGRVFGIGALAVALGGCNDEGTATPPRETTCGSGALTASAGTGNPFEALAPLVYPIQVGLQGGFHIDVSIRAQGALDPDHTDIELVLRQGEVARARHITADWLLYVDPAGPWCDYPLARLVLVDENNSLLPRERLPEVADTPLALDITLASPLGGGTVTQMVTLRLPE